MPPLQRARVPSLVRERRSHKLPSAAKYKKEGERERTVAGGTLPISSNTVLILSDAQNSSAEKHGQAGEATDTLLIWHNWWVKEVLHGVLVRVEEGVGVSGRQPS